MPDARRRAPLILGSVTALAMVAAILAYLLIGTTTSSAGSATYTNEEATAVAAAQTEVANVFTFRRASFEADYQRALRGLTGSVTDDIKRNKANTLSTMTAGKFDLSVKITHTALIGPVVKNNVKGYVLLVSFNGYRSTQQNQPTQQNLQVTVVSQNGKWLLSEIMSIGITSS